MLKIPLGDLAPDPALDDAPAHEQNVLDETMSLALEAKNGLRLDFTSKSNAEAMRFRFYKRIKRLRANGVKSFDSLVFRLEGNALILKRIPSFTISEIPDGE